MNSHVPPAPPSRYGDLDELEKIFATSLPELATQMAGLFGKRTPRLRKKDVLRQEAKLHNFLLAARPYLLGLRALAGQSDRDQCVYSLLEGLLREQLRAGGKKIPSKKDSFEFLLRSAERVVISPRQRWAKSAPYSASKQAMYELAVYVHERLNPLAVEELMGAWARSKDARKLIQFGVQWGTVTRQFRFASPKRLTIRLANQLAEEYRTSSSFLEQRLRLFVFLDHIACGGKKSWTDWEKTSLFKLLKEAEASPRLNWIPPLLERHVRNALAHGQPEINLDAQECRFHDREVTVAWKMPEFFEKTRTLTLAARALFEFESILSLVQVRFLVGRLWGGLAAAATVSP